MKPHVQIGFENGNIGTVATSPDGVCGIVGCGTESGDFKLETVYTIYSLKEAELLGIKPTIDNYELHKTIKEFYQEAGTGTELWIYGVPKFAGKFLDIIPSATILLTASNRRIRFVIVKIVDPGVATSNGIAGYLPQMFADAQTCADDFTLSKIHPVNFIFEAYGYTGDPLELTGFATATHNRVRVLIGDTETRTGPTQSFGAAVGVYAGRLARNQVHVNAGRVKDGALKPLQFYIVDTPAEQVNVAPLYDKGFNTVVTHVGKSGFYFIDDLMACTVEDDYHFGPQRRVIDKAYVLANGVLTNFILDTVPLGNEGKISPIYAKVLETEIERVIAQEMTAKGELSGDPTVKGDSGVKAIIDLEERIAVTSTIKGRIRVKPHGYGRYLEFGLGFNINE
jgi:Protein of unknown function (DUF2586)